MFTSVFTINSVFTMYSVTVFTVNYEQCGFVHY